MTEKIRRCKIGTDNRGLTRGILEEISSPISLSGVIKQTPRLTLEGAAYPRNGYARGE